MFAIPLLTGCDAILPTGCDAYAAYGLSVAVRDSATGAPVTDSLHIVASSSTYTDTRDGSSEGGVFGLAPERPGVYTVTVSHPNAREWQRSGIQVKSDRCHVIPVSVPVRLQMLP
jgi:hypothetical protein